MTNLDMRRRWLALYVLCLGDLMIVLDGTIVNVALPSIRDDLGFSQTSLAWVVNAYLLTFGGFLLLGGRLGDLFGHRRLFLSGIALFTAASLACGVATSQGSLVAARAVQGMGGAVVSAVALSLLMMLFTDQGDRAKAMGVFGFVLSGGGVIGVLAGGFLTDILSWHWIFLVNLPVGVVVFLLTLRLLPPDGEPMATGRVDYAGAITVTGSLMLAVYAIVNGNEEGWTSAQTLGMLGAAGLLMIAFLVIEARISNPLMPLGIFRNRSVSTANVLGALLAAGMFAYFFFSALYMQLVLGYSPMEVGLAYLPGTVVWGASSLLLSDRLVMRFGIKPPLIAGLGLMVVALLLLARMPVEGDWLVDILPATIFIGLGAGIAFNPILLAAMSGVPQERAGLASGVVNTAFMMGGAVGLAALAAIAASRTENLRDSGEGALEALNSGYHLAFLVGAIFIVASAVVAATLPRSEPMGAHGVEPAGVPAAAEAD
ncbi:MAG: DHA2 family efflux MFS transporter permease subunit [Gaiellaceae bacterium]